MTRALLLVALLGCDEALVRTQMGPPVDSIESYDQAAQIDEAMTEVLGVLARIERDRGGEAPALPVPDPAYAVAQIGLVVYLDGQRFAEYRPCNACEVLEWRELRLGSGHVGLDSGWPHSVFFRLPRNARLVIQEQSDTVTTFRMEMW